MKKIICLIAVCLAFLSCKKDDTQDKSCIDDTWTAYYLDFWKEEFLKRNSMSPGYFDAHISQIKTSTNCWNSGITFRVSYKVTIDWAEIDDYNDFMIKLASSDPAYQHLSIPRDTFLNASQLQIILDNEVASSSIGPVKSISSLKYGSYSTAVKAFQDSVKSRFIVPERMNYFVPGKLPRKDGYPYFIGYGIINRDLNQCIYGYFNLVTGESYADTTACEVQ